MGKNGRYPLLMVCAALREEGRQDRVVRDGLDGSGHCRAI